MASSIVEETALTIATLTRFIALMFAALFAPAGMLARVRGLSLVQLWLFAYGLAEMRRDGERLRYPGESAATVAARIDLLVWLAFDPFAARRHLARTARGWRRARLGKSAPPAFTPPHVPLARAGVAPRAPLPADTS